MWVLAGFEVSGIVDKISDSLSDCSLAVGDRVVVYPTEEELAETGSVNFTQHTSATEYSWGLSLQ